MHTIDEYERFGFRPAEIVGLLKFHQIPIDLGVEITGEAAPSKSFPEWKRIMSLEPRLPLREWIFAFIDVDPYQGEFLTDIEQADFQRYEDLLTRAIVRRDLRATEDITNRNEQTWQIEARALQIWCQAKGIIYPLPPHVSAAVPMSSQPATVRPGRWPWGDHSTRALELLADAARQWWSTYDPDEPNTAPTNRAVVEYLVRKGASGKTAESIATLLRADDLQTGRRKSSTD